VLASTPLPGLPAHLKDGDAGGSCEEVN